MEEHDPPEQNFAKIYSGPVCTDLDQWPLEMVTQFEKILNLVVVVIDSQVIYIFVWKYFAVTKIYVSNILIF